MFRNIIGNCKIFGRPIFQGGPQYTRITTRNMYLLIEIMHNILVQCHGIYIEVKQNSYMFKNDILRDYSQKMGVLWGDF